jgi:3-methylcrotonyl-CoA carboxylase alpha subunit
MKSKRIKKILIANRSEIAIRIMDSAKKMGIVSVAVFSDSDRDSLHVKLADEAYALGGDTPVESYLNIKKIIGIASKSNCDAIHPGYGFLAENAEFAKACEAASIVFIGPKAETIALMGDKAEAKTFAKANNIPVIPGEENLKQDLATFSKESQKIGFPLLVKASAGGGGKGMKIVRSAEELESAFTSAKREALSAFGDDNLLIEKYFDKARHVEVQVLADQHGEAVHLFDRDCSLQRRHQKVIEEAPAYGLSDDCRKKMYDCAIKLCKLIDYQGAGTLEFLLDEKEEFYLMEMNTRLQVEHAVSEQITGIDLVKEQILVAQGKKLSFKQKDIIQTGHAIEARLYAEESRNNFLPSSGKIAAFSLPKANETCRLDHALTENIEITALYDPMIGKISCWGHSRNEAINRLEKSLSETHILGIESNRDFLRACLQHQAFVDNKIHTKFIESYIDELNNSQEASDEGFSSISELFKLANKVLEQESLPIKKHSPWHQGDYWRVNGSTGNKFSLQDRFSDTVFTFENRECLSSFSLKKIKADSTEKTLLAHWKQSSAFEKGLLQLKNFKNEEKIAELLISGTNGDFKISLQNALTEKENKLQDSETRYQAPLNARVISVNIKNGMSVEKDQELLVLEAMKMEHIIRAKTKGTIEGLNIKADQQVEADQFLFEIKAEQENKNE